MSGKGHEIGSQMAQISLKALQRAHHVAQEARCVSACPSDRLMIWNMAPGVIIDYTALAEA